MFKITILLHSLFRYDINCFFLHQLIQLNFFNVIEF
jgi:hypothetical protein